MTDTMSFNEDGVPEYLKAVGAHKLLSREDEVVLFQRVESGDDSAREEVIKCNLRLVVKIAMQFKGCGVAIADLIQEGNVGLLNVISRFDWRRGFRFSTYAAFWIRQEIQSAIRNYGSFIRLPIRKARLMGHISDAIRFFNSHEGRDPSVEEIATFLHEDMEKVAALMPFRDSVLSLDAERPQADNLSLLESIPETGPKPGDRLAQEQADIVVHGAMRYLTDRERQIVDLRFGLTDGKSLSLRKTSKKVGLSQEGVRRVERRALGKLQRPTIMAQMQGLLTA